MANPSGFTDRQLALRRLEALRSERSTWMAQWQELSTHIAPRLGRFYTADRNLGNKRHAAIYDRAGLKAHRVLAAGMMAGMTSPARPWFRLATPDRDLMEYGPVKLWLDDVTRMMRDVFAVSNTYRALHQGYEELGCFGTAATLVLPNFADVIRHHPMTCGEYMISTNHDGIVDTFYREFQMRVSQLVDQFGLDKCSPAVVSNYQNGSLDVWIDVVQVIEPRRNYDPSSPLAKDREFKHCYFEKGGGGDNYLFEGGFKRFPLLAPRWAATGGDIYGQSPAMEALGHVKALQHKAKRKSQGIDAKTMPALRAPTAMKGRERDMLPGGVVFSDEKGSVEPLFQGQYLDLQHLLEDIHDERRQVDEAFYADLFLMLANMDRNPQMTAREIAERHEEKLLMLGPVLERLHNELLKPLIDITFDEMWRVGMLPPIPPELGDGGDLDVDFVSMLAQAQRAVSTGSVDRLLGTVGMIAQFKPEVTDKVDTDQLVDEYADMLGVPAKLIVPDDKVEAVRAERQKQMAAQAQAEQAPAMAQTAKTLSETPTDEPGTALGDVISQFSGLGAP